MQGPRPSYVLVHPKSRATEIGRKQSVRGRGFAVDAALLPFAVAALFPFSGRFCLIALPRLATPCHALPFRWRRFDRFPQLFAPFPNNLTLFPARQRHALDGGGLQQYSNPGAPSIRCLMSTLESVCPGAYAQTHPLRLDVIPSFPGSVPRTPHRPCPLRRRCNRCSLSISYP